MVDYKKMSADELIHIISNKALNKNMKENDKLVIQDCCKELFKKKETLQKYKKIKYVHSKYCWDEHDESDSIKTKIKSKIIPVIDDEDGEVPSWFAFPKKIDLKLLKTIQEEKNTIIGNNMLHTYTILEVEDL